MPGNVIARELIPFGGELGGTLQQFAWSEALQSFLFALQWIIVTMKHPRDNIPSSHQPGWLE